MSNGDLLWWVSRGTGLVALLALTLGLTLGVTTGWRPTFLGAGLHRVLSMAGLALVVAHVSAVVLDGYAPVGWLDAIIPFRSPYRVLWTGLGTLSFDLMLLAAVTSIRPLRRRLGHQFWRGVHLLSWLCWPVAVAHGLATGTDTRAAWVLMLTLLCVALVAGVLGVRVAGPSRWWAAWPAAVLGVVVTVVLTAAGPAQADWASRAGTPTGIGGTAVAGSAWRSRLLSALDGPGVVVVGKLQEQLETNAATERAREVFSTALPGGSLTLVLEGPAFETGLTVASSALTFGPTSSPALFRGAVQRVSGTSYLVSASGPGVRDWRLMLDVEPQGPVSWKGRLTAA